MIFNIESRPTCSCHAPTIVETPNTIIAAWSGGTYEGHSDFGIWMALFDGSKWSTPFEIKACSNVSSPPFWNPVLFYPEDGPLMLFYKAGKSVSRWYGMLTTSTDDGKTWSNPQKLGTHEKIGNILGPIKNKPVQLADGSILCPSSTEHRSYWRVHFELTRDLGKSWEIIGPINDSMFPGVIQPSILTYPDGRLQILCRSMNKFIHQSWSDNVSNWSELTPTELPNPNSGIDAVTLKDGRQVVAYNHTHTGRSPLNLAISSDGVHWDMVLLLKEGKGEFSYPALIQTRDGMIHIVYTHLRKSIEHVAVDPETF